MTCQGKQVSDEDLGERWWLFRQEDENAEYMYFIYGNTVSSGLCQEQEVYDRASGIFVYPTLQYLCNFISFFFMA